MTYLTDEHRQLVRETIMRRLRDDGVEAATAQRDRLSKAAANLSAQAAKRGWGEHGQWPGDANRTYSDLLYYVQQFDIISEAYR